jgi:hypothetical protein
MNVPVTPIKTCRASARWAWGWPDRICQIRRRPASRKERGRKTRGVFHVGFHRYHVRLHAAALIDRHFAVRSADLQNQYRLVRPFPGLKKSLVRGRIDKHVVESWIAAAIRGPRRTVGHAEPGSDKRPLAIMLGQNHFAVACVLRCVLRCVRAKPSRHNPRQDRSHTKRRSSHAIPP